MSAPPEGADLLTGSYRIDEHDLSPLEAFPPLEYRPGDPRRSLLSVEPLTEALERRSVLNPEPIPQEAAGPHYGSAHLKREALGKRRLSGANRTGDGHDDREMRHARTVATRTRDERSSHVEASWKQPAASARG